MEFEVDDYLGLPMQTEELYAQTGGAKKYNVLGKDQFVDQKKDESYIFVKSTAGIESDGLQDVKGFVLSETVAVTGPAVAHILEDYAKPWNPPTVDPSFKQGVLNHLIVEGAVGTDLQILDPVKQFPFLQFFHDLHAKAVLGGTDDVPAFGNDIVSKYTWIANTLSGKKESAENDSGITGVTKSDILVKWQAYFPETSPLHATEFDQIAHWLMNPNLLVDMMKEALVPGTGGPGAGGPGGPPVPLPAAGAGPLNDALDAVVEELAEELVGAGAGPGAVLGGAIDEVVNELALDLAPVVHAGGAVEPKTAEEYLMDLAELDA